MQSATPMQSAAPLQSATPMRSATPMPRLMRQYQGYGASDRASKILPYISTSLPTS
jgi:hypothetical protein